MWTIEQMEVLKPSNAHNTEFPLCIHVHWLVKWCTYVLLKCRHLHGVCAALAVLASSLNDWTPLRAFPDNCAALRQPNSRHFFLLTCLPLHSWQGLLVSRRCLGLRSAKHVCRVQVWVRQTAGCALQATHFCMVSGSRLNLATVWHCFLCGTACPHFPHPSLIISF